jgi:hypothetical protein
LTNSQELLGHLKLHKDVPYYECRNCKKKFICAINYKNHLVEHSFERFFCFYCFYKEPTRVKIDDHMIQVHKIFDLVCWPLNGQKKDLQKDVFVIAPKTITAEQYINFLQKFIQMDQYNENVANSQKTRFKSNEIELLPTSAIFINPLQCWNCGYSTKVRTNLCRHLKMNQCEVKTEPSNTNVDASSSASESSRISNVYPTSTTMNFVKSDPVNPVPCLESNERHFDKMANFACDAYQEAVKSAKVIHSKDIIDVDDLIEYDGSNDNDIEIIDDSTISKDIQSQTKNLWPKFVPIPKRFSCNASGCKYQSVDDDLLKQHLKTFHADEKNYKCPHCQIVLCFTMDFENIIHHMKLHGETLFKCSVCSQCHYDYSLLNTHVKNSHSKDDSIATTVTLRNFSSAIDTESSVAKKKNDATFVKPGNWLCEMCRFNCHTRADMNAHMVAHHNTRYQFKCSVCEYFANNLKLFEKHFSQCHMKVENLKVLFMFQQTNLLRNNTDLQLASICTQPLWSRNMQKVKHIRGILFDENESKKPNQPIAKKRRQTNESLLNPVQTPLEKFRDIKCMFNDIMYTCYHCKKFYSDRLENLTRHWNIRHKNSTLTSSSVVYPGKPFQFYIQKVVCCFYCQFSSVYDEVRSHLTISHNNKPPILTNKLNSNKCGLCKFVVNAASTSLIEHFQEVHGDKFDPAKDDFGPTDNLTDELVDSILGATNLLYSCKKCEEFKSCILPDVENHMITIHGMTPEDGFQYFYETQPIDLKVDAMKTMTYECHYNITESTLCKNFLKTFDQLVDHIYEHFLHRQFMCIYCESFGGTLEILCSHYKKEHPEYFTRLISHCEEFKFRRPKNLPDEFSNYRMHFVNGFVVKFRDAYNIKYSPKDLIMEQINAKNQRLLDEFRKTQPFSGVKLVTWKGEIVEPNFTGNTAETAPFLRIASISEGVENAFPPVPSSSNSNDITLKSAEFIDYDKIVVFDEDDDMIPFQTFKLNHNILPDIKLTRLDDKLVNNMRDSSEEPEIDSALAKFESETKLLPVSIPNSDDEHSSNELIIDETPIHIPQESTMLKKLLLEDFVDPRLSQMTHKNLSEPSISASSSVLREILQRPNEKPKPISLDNSTDDDDVIILD